MSSTHWLWLCFLLQILTTPTSNPIKPAFPCAPPHQNSHPFCNTSLPTSLRAKNLISLLTLSEKLLQLGTNASAVPRLGIPPYFWWSESLHGINANGPGVSFSSASGPVHAATVFPQVILTAAAFNRSLWRSVAAAIAAEGRAMYNVGQAGLTFWAPNINVFRDPRWGRGQETPGEDPGVAAAYAVEYVRGFQFQEGVEWRKGLGFGGKRVLLSGGGGDGDGMMLSACCKHFTAYDLEKWGGFTRYDFNAVVSNTPFVNPGSGVQVRLAEQVVLSPRASGLFIRSNTGGGSSVLLRVNKPLLLVTELHPRNSPPVLLRVNKPLAPVSNLKLRFGQTTEGEYFIWMSSPTVCQVTEQDMQDTYQPPFRSCIQEGKASCLMCSYNAVNGVPACARGDLLQQARKEWGFEGYITSDCDAVATIYEYQNYTKTPEDAVAVALKAGMDINCGSYVNRHVQSAIDQGKLQEEDIDRAVLNLFSVQIRLGLFDGDPRNGQFGTLGPQDVCSSKHKKLALEAARQGIVLLKNYKKFMPLNKHSVSSLAIIGPMANTTALGGGYSGVPCSPQSIFDAFSAYAKKTSYAAGCLDGVPCTSNAGFMEAVSIGKEADFVIIVAGLDLTQETEDRDRYSLLMPGFQAALVTTLAAVTKKPVVLVLTGGGPIDVSFAEGDSRIASILWIGYPGEAGGKALAEAIFGDYNPGGRLPMTWYPESFTSVPMNDMHMRADPSRGYPGRTHRFYTGPVIYGFGHGLSYTSYTYNLLSAPSKLSLFGSFKGISENMSPGKVHDELDYIRIEDVEFCDSLIFHVHVSVVNNGGMDGSHVVMLFSRVPKVFKGTPERQLIGFDRVHTVSYRSTETKIMVDPCEHLSTVDELGKRVLPLGDHTLMLLDVQHVVSVHR